MDAVEQKHKRAEVEQKGVFARIAQEKQEKKERDRRQNPTLPDPKWPETLGSLSDISPLVERLQALVLEFQKEFPQRGIASYGTFENRLSAVQRAAAESNSSRPAGVIEVLGKLDESDARQQYVGGRPSIFPPPVSLINSVIDFESELLKSSFQSLFGDSAEVVPEEAESPRSYIGRIAQALADRKQYGELLELLPLVSISKIYGSSGDSDWIRADMSGITSFRQASAFLEAEDIRNAVPAFRKVIESGGRHAPVEESAKILAQLKEKYPEEMKRIR